MIIIYTCIIIIIHTKIYIFCSKYDNDSDLRTQWSNSLQAFGLMRFPHFTDLLYYLHNKKMVNIPLEEVPDLMMKVSYAFSLLNNTYLYTLKYVCLTAFILVNKFFPIGIFKILFLQVVKIVTEYKLVFKTITFYYIKLKKNLTRIIILLVLYCIYKYI